VRKGSTLDSLHEILISAPALKVYEAWTTKTGLEQWWTSDVSAQHGNAVSYELGFDGGNVKFYFQPIEEVPGARIRWTGVDGLNMPAEWVDTEIDVQISIAADGRTRLQFAHRNWRSIEGFYCVCNTSWGELMYRLRDACEGHSRGAVVQVSRIQRERE
jgi:uncharacterized protein YndB with AHSA1/START domain